ncbi:hypothetical protein AAVH_19118 [Aphelenchoides avenae]|nr:hypothetical protein AAVH_19118 [Aphelenchus avenae]
MSGKSGPTVKGRFTLKIANISTFMTKIGQRIQSPRQQMGGLGWHIETRPQVVDNITNLACYLRGDERIQVVRLGEGHFSNRQE